MPSDKRDLGDAFDFDFDQPTDSPAPDFSTDSVNAGLFGIESFNSPTYKKSTLIDLMLVRPDVEQARRAIPSAVRTVARAQLGPLDDPQHVVPTLQLWQRMASDERGAELDWRAHIEAAETERGQHAEQPDADDPDADQPPGPIEASLLQLVDLAASIHRDGLTNPITVVREGAQYRIETGERRWLSFHLLRLLYPGDENYALIPARPMDDFSVWRQASENNARDDLNAVGKARQLARLLMALHVTEPFQPLAHFEHEQDYYAQVADGNQYRIPRGMGEQVMNAMGFTSPGQVRKYRALLRIPRDLWDRADDEDLPEGAIRALMNGDSPHHEEPSPPPASPAPTQPSASKPGDAPNRFDTWYRKRLPDLRRDLNEMKGHERREIIEELRKILDNYA